MIRDCLASCQEPAASLVASTSPLEYELQGPHKLRGGPVAAKPKKPIAVAARPFQACPRCSCAPSDAPPPATPVPVKAMPRALLWRSLLLRRPDQSRGLGTPYLVPGPLLTGWGALAGVDQETVAGRSHLQ